MTNKERIELLEQAQSLIAEAQYLADSAMDGTREQTHYEAYGKCGMTQALGEGNPHDDSLDKLIEKLSEQADESEYFEDFYGAR